MKCCTEVIFMDQNREIIRSRQNRSVVEICKLTDRRAREERGAFRFDGIKLFMEALHSGVTLDTVVLKESEADRIMMLAHKAENKKSAMSQTRILTLSDELFDRISEEKSPEGVICIAKYIDKIQKNITIYNSAEFFNMKNERIVLLESVRDPSNIGAIIRSAAAMDVDRLILSADCADIYHPRAVRASMGTLFSQPIDRVTDLDAVIKGLQGTGRRVFAAALSDQAQLLGTVEQRAGDCVVIGNEGHGLTEKTVAACDGCVMIPMSSRAESFNAAVAASILMWEFAKH